MEGEKKVGKMEGHDNAKEEGSVSRETLRKVCLDGEKKRKKKKKKGNRGMTLPAKCTK